MFSFYAAASSMPKESRAGLVYTLAFQDTTEEDSLTQEESDRFRNFGKSIYNFFNKDLVKGVKDLSRGSMSDFLAVNHLKNLNLKLW